MSKYQSQLKYHVIEPGQSREEVADLFGVSVEELLEHNAAVLGERWDAGVEVRDPSNRRRLVKEAVKLGATAEQIAAALKMSVDSVVDTYDALRADELQDIPKTNQKKIGPVLRDIRVTAKRVPESLPKTKENVVASEEPKLDNTAIRAELSDILDAPRQEEESKEEEVVFEPAPEVDVYALLGDPNEVISEGAAQYYKNWTDSWGKTPVEDIPQEELVKMSGFFFNAYKDTPIDEIPKNVLPIVMNTLIQVTAEDTKDTYEQWANSLPDLSKMQTNSEQAAFAFLNAIPFYTPSQETLSQFAYMAGSSARGPAGAPIRSGRDLFSTVTGVELEAPEKYSLQKEFEYRVRRLQSGAGFVTAPELLGALADPYGVFGGSFTTGMAASGKLGPITSGLVGTTLEGTGFGAMMPVYPEFGDSRLLNMGGGAIAGFGLSSAILSPVIAAQTGQALARKVAVKSPEQQRLYPDATPTERSEVSFFDTRVPAERDEILAAQTQETQGVQVPVDPMTPTSLDPPKITLNVKPFVSRVSETITPEQAKKTILESNVDIRVIDQQIVQLEAKAAKSGRRKRRPIEKKIVELKEARAKRLNKIEEKVLHNNSRIINLNKIIADAAANPSKKGVVARAIRAKRTALQLEKENVFHLTGGHALVDWADPVQTAAFRSFAIESGNKFIVPPRPNKTGNVVEDTIAELNYTISTGSKRSGDSSVTTPTERDTVGFEPQPSLSSAGVRPSVMYADELASRGYGEDSIPGFGVSKTEARATYKEDPEAFSGVAPELRSQEQMGRDILNEEATEGQRAVIQGELAGYSPDEVANSMEQISYRIEGGWDNLERLAARIREEDIDEGYNSMVDFVMDPDNKTRLMSGEFTEALQPLWIQAENRRTQYGQKLYDLQQEGLVNSEAYVQAFNEYMLATHVTDIYKAIGSARGRALNQLKKMKQLMTENARKTKKGVIIDNLFGVKCG